MKKSIQLFVLAIALIALAPSARSQSFTENFTGTSTNNSWFFFTGACLTAGSTSWQTSMLTPAIPAVAGSVNPGQIPSCGSMYSTTGGYYNIGNQTGIPLIGGFNGTVPGTDATNGGALRFTNVPGNGTNKTGAYPQGYFESGAILSNFSFPLATQGLQVTFVTETYGGDGGGTGADGADGISFFLQDAVQIPDLGSTGGSLAYTCSNTNNDGTLRASGQPRGFDGLTGGYIGVGIDEYGNFMNGVVNTLGTTTTASGDNTATGGGYRWNRVGVRGTGNVSWSWLNTNYPSYYPSSLTNAQRAAAVQQTCISGKVMDYSAGVGTATTITVPDYRALSQALLPSTTQIANEGALYRGDGTASRSGATFGVPISYNVKITTDGLLTLSYSINGGASINVIAGQNIKFQDPANPTVVTPLPDQVRFGFAGSDGGSTNIHEVMCFQASPQQTAASSASGNQKQSAPVVQGTQVYFAFYDPTSWAGAVTATSLLIDSSNNAFLNSTANWDASCNLTGVTTCTKTGVAGPTTAPDPVAHVTDPASTAVAGRTMLTTTGTGGIPFRWPTDANGNITSAEQSALDFADTVQTANRLNYLRGVRTGEQNSSGTSGIAGVVYRARTSVLGDVVDSSPTWVGAPSSGFPNVWSDALLTTNAATIAENGTSAPTYASFATAMGSRTNMVYAGANDGFLHAFRAGFSVNGVYQGTGSGSSFVGTNNDGRELLAYMPGYTINHIQSANSDGTTNPDQNYSDLQYAHQFDVDATPGTGDVFYGNAWHTVLVGGLGAGGAGLYALDITNPDSSSTSGPTFLESNASSIVLGDWTAANLTCTNSSTCAQALGNTYGTPQIRRFHNGQWGAVFGNGFGSTNGDGGIYVMLFSSTGTPSFYYLSTGTGPGAMTFTGVIASGTGVLTVSGASANGLVAGALITGSGVPTGTILGPQMTGTTGGNGTYHTNLSTRVRSTTMSAPNSLASLHNGIGYVSTADLDGDHITDYVYAGDLLGNVWRFDLTSKLPANWGVMTTGTVANTPAAGTALPLYAPATAALGTQPITSKVAVLSFVSAPNQRIMIEFGTGQQIPLSSTGAASYANATQALYGIWDWNMTAWNTASGIKYAALPFGGVSAPSRGTAIGQLQAQIMTPSTVAGTDFRSVTATAVCWPGLTGCTTSNQMGWTLPLVSGHANAADVNLPTSTGGTPTVYEQIIFNPVLVGDTFIINTTIPSAASLTNCFSANAGGYTMALNPATGGAFTQTVFGPQNVGTNFNGVGVSGTGSVFAVTTGNGTTGSTTTGSTGSHGASGSSGTTTTGTSSSSGGSGSSSSGGGSGGSNACGPGTKSFLITQTVSGNGTVLNPNLQCNVAGGRLTWIQRR
jgi:type IV pilus assembly protein PilY1